ncbi:hypothetical protein [Actinoplanes couchii]|uniref:hypothetical protein n=1 Tax=Actinoplanes couchii TaxID=403638 RepID=UPI001EF1FCB9|nr:hypothetical protein [Actinoplanes couchii]MDR6322628.1 type II secretory pathway pseudopilin PulG [Actinoplanes couchii]
MSRDADTGTGGARARRSEGADTRRSGIRSGKGRDTAAPVDGAAALSIEVTGETPPVPGGRPRLWVAPPLPIQAPRATFAVAIIAVILVGIVGILLVSTKTMEQSFRLDALRNEKTVLDKQQQELERQLVEASGPGNLTAAARRLGLVAHDDPAVLRLPNGDIIRPLTPGQGPTSPTSGKGLGEKPADESTEKAGTDADATKAGADATNAGADATNAGADATKAGAGDAKAGTDTMQSGSGTDTAQSGSGTDTAQSGPGADATKTGE